MTTAERFSTHAEPAWRERANFVINAKLPEEGRFEQLWARQLTEDTFELCCIPFFPYDIALGDVVQTHEVFGRKYMLDRVIRPSGHYVFRVHFSSAAQPKDDVADQLAEMGAVLEWSSRSLLAVDALDDEHAQRIADFLQAREDLGQLLYETGRSA